METKEKKKRVSHRGDAIVENRKLRLLYLMDYMRENSDERHPVKINTIAQYLTDKGIYTTRKALYDDFAVLDEYGFKITRKAGTYVYYYSSPLFDIGELKLLTDIIYSSGFISERMTQIFIQKFEQFCSRHQRIQLDHLQDMLTISAKSRNENVLENVNDICDAIAKDCEISFLYVDYMTANGEKHYRNKGRRFIRSPYHLIYSDGQYYLVCYNSEARMREHLRVDRMEDIVPLGGQRRKGIGTMNRDAARNYTKYTFSMFADGEKLTKVTMRFTNNMIGVVYDRFGDNVMIIPDDDRHFTITQDIAVSRQFFGWVLGLGKQAVIVRPNIVREELRNYVKEIGVMYEDYPS